MVLLTRIGEVKMEMIQEVHQGTCLNYLNNVQYVGRLGDKHR